MALDLAVTYPGQVAVDAGYPQGKARNVTVEGDGTGTPWEEDLVNDWLGFFQSLLDEAGVSPSGNPDEVGTSDYLDSLKAIIGQEVELQDLDTAGDWTFAGAVEFGAAVTAAVGSTLTVAGVLVLGGTNMTLQLPLVCNTYGRVVDRVEVFAADSDVGVDIEDASFFHLPTGIYSDNRVVTLGTDGAQEGDIVEFTTRDATYTMTVNGVAHKYASGFRAGTRWLFTSSAWTVILETYMP